MAGYEDFEKWWLATAPGLFQLARQFGDDSLDLVQDVAVAALIEIQRSEKQSPTIWQSEDHFRNWARMRLRWFALDQARHQSYVKFLNPDVLANHPARGGTSEEQLVEKEWNQQRNEQYKQLRALMVKLPDRQQKAMEASMRGESSGAIAKDLGISVSTVRSLQRFARHKLAKMLELKEK